MSSHPFYQLAPFIQEYIYREKWADLRPVQVDAIDAILNGPNHVLICSATASGKTEAALLPIITELHRQPPASIGALYIGPLKALINDQFERISGLLEGTYLPVQSWHGDVSQNKKLRFMKRARGILQITPESLEAMLMNRHHELRRLFGDLRYVIIDEVHAFIDSDRGRQVMCQLERLAGVQSLPLRKVGLSATLGEPELAARWLRGRSPLDAHVIKVGADATIDLALEYFLFPDPELQRESQAMPNRKRQAGLFDESKSAEKPKRLGDLLAETGADSKRKRGGDLYDDSKAKSADKRGNNSLAGLESLLVDPDVYYRHLHNLTQRVPQDAHLRQ